MKRSSPTTSCASESSSGIHRRSTPTDRAVACHDRGDVDHWVAMINAELDADDVCESEVGGRLPTPVIDHKTVEVTIEFGRTLIEESAPTLVAGSLIQLDQLVDEPVDLVVDGRAIARGELIVVDGKLGVRVVELLMLFFLGFVLCSATVHAEERVRTGPRVAMPEIDEPFDESLSSTQPSRPSKTNLRSILGDSDTQFPSERTVKAGKNTPITLSPPSSLRDHRLAKGNSEDADGGLATSRPSWGSTVWPLLAVIGVIVCGARWLKSHSTTAARGLPTEAFDVLGRHAIDQRTSVMLARCGSRILVLSLSPHGLQTLTEITDPVEIDCLAGLCRTTRRDHGLVETFRTLLHKPAPKKPAVAAQSNLPNDSRWPDRMLTGSGVPSSTREARE